jgi:hypothetical protein
MRTVRPEMTATNSVERRLGELSSAIIARGIHRNTPSITKRPVRRPWSKRHASAGCPAERRRFLTTVGRRLTAQALERRDSQRRYPILLTLLPQSATDVPNEVVQLFNQTRPSPRREQGGRRMRDALASEARPGDQQALLGDLLVAITHGRGGGVPQRGRRGHRGARHHLQHQPGRRRKALAGLISDR